MSTPATKTFNLDPGILGPNSAASVTVGTGLSPDLSPAVLEAIVQNAPFPTPPSGGFQLGSVALQASGGNSVVFNAGQGKVSFNFAASFKTGVGVFGNATDAINSLQLNTPPKMDLSSIGAGANEYLVMQVGYQASGSVSGSHQIGLLGTLTFGAQTSADSVYAILHAFPTDTGAATALGDTIASWRLPRHITKPDDLKPGTWIIVEADGSVAVQLAAQLGYNLNYVRQSNFLGMSRELGVKIAANMNATFGFSASGKYIVIVGRESDGPTIRLRLFKQADKGLNFGLNLNVAVTGQANLPANIDDFVQAVFGVHGLQVVNDLHIIEQWTDPNQDLGKNIAGLTNKIGLDLFTKVTGVDARAEFDKARQLVLNAFQQWDALPSRASAALWGIIGKADPAAATEFQTFLTALANPDPQARASALANALIQVSFGSTPEGQWLESIASQGLLALSNDLDSVQQLAAQALNILNGGVIKQLQDFITQHLDLNAVRNVVTQDDFDTLDGWLVNRLSDFLDKQLDLAAIKEIQTAITTVINKASSIYQSAVKALNNTYNLNFAASYQRNTSDTALLDVNFDLSQQAASNMLTDVLVNSDLNALLVDQVAGVTLNQATISHEIKRNTDVQVHLPYFDSETQTINDSLASMTVEHDSGRVLAYQLGATDTINVKNRYMSQLSVIGNLRIANGQLQAGTGQGESVAYQSLQVKPGMTLTELEFRTKPFLREMLGAAFPTDASLQPFFDGLSQTIGNKLGQTRNIGDVALNFQVSLPATVLGAWFKPLSAAQVTAASMSMSTALQAALKKLIPFFYFQELHNLQPNPTAAALLAWSAFPLSTSIDFEDGEIKQFNTDEDVFWNFPDPDLRKAMANDAHTSRALAPILADAHARLLAAGDNHGASFFAPNQIGSFLQQASDNSMGDTLLQNLLITESQMVRGAAKALTDVQQMLAQAATMPLKAIPLLAEFGAGLTETFNSELSVYGNEAVRTLNSMLLIEAAKAIDPTFMNTTPTAMFNLFVLATAHQFQLTDFLSGGLPSQSDIAVSQALTNLGG